MPYRGGIAQYNTLLARAFAEQGDDALFVSFSRQYPRWLYPGKGDIDLPNADHREPGALYLIDSMNPVTWWKAARRSSVRACTSSSSTGGRCSGRRASSR